MATTYEQHLKDINIHLANQCQSAFDSLYDAKTEDDVWQALFICNRGNRPDLLMNAICHHQLSQKTINEMIEYVWIDSENVYHYRYEWDEVWCNYNNPYQNKLIKRIFKQPKKLYRVGNLDGEYQSWTLCKDVAKFFGIRARREQDRVWHEEYFSAEQVVAIFNDRKEKEIIIRS